MYCACYGTSQRLMNLDAGVCMLQSKKSQEGINTRLALVMKSGKFTLGTKTCLKCLRSGKGTLFFRQLNCQM